MISTTWRDHDGLLSLDKITRSQALAVLCVVGLLILLGLAPAKLQSAPRPAGPPDMRLYEAVIDDVAHGQSYYAAVAHEHRLGRAPLRPFLAVRPPLLAKSLAALPDPPARSGALKILAGATWIAWAWRLRDLLREPLRYGAAVILAASGIGLALADGAYLFHEEWAGLLIALSLALRTPRTWLPSVTLGLLAALLRELALPFLAAMAFMALLERRRLEAAAWSAALLAAGLALAPHAAAVARVTTTADLASPGWTTFGGWAFVLHLVEFNCALLAAPTWIPALVLPAALVGLVFWQGGGSGLGRRIAIVVLGYLLAFCVIGRPDNDYWGILIAPLWPLGLLQADRVVAGLAAACRRPLDRSAPASAA